MSQPVRFSHLRAYGRSPMHGHHARTAPEGEPTAAMQLGEATHALTFGNKPVCGYPGAVRRGKDYEAFVEAHPGHIILGANDYAKAQRMADAVRSCPVAEPLLRGVYETTLLFKWMGLDCRVTPDCRGAGYLTELKTSQTSDPNKFMWHARRMAYHAQMRFQEYGCAAQGHKILVHWIIAVEATEPHPVTVFHVEPEALEEGDKMLTLWAERLKACEAAQHFPPYVDCAVPLCWPKEEDGFEFLEEAA